MLHFGLIGYPLSHSFSAKFFTEKFKSENIDARYDLFTLENLDGLTRLIEKHQLSGLNVTIPHKQNVLPFLSKIDEAAYHAGAVNCIRIQNGQLHGYNTDITGFQQGFLDYLPKNRNHKALIFGSGGASKAVRFCLEKYKIPYLLVGRSKTPETITYQDVSEDMLREHNLLINTTPVGMYPDENSFVNIPYHFISNDHIALDLIYNPASTAFLNLCAAQGAATKNGLDMLYIQAEESFRIFMQ